MNSKIWLLVVIVGVLPLAVPATAFAEAASSAAGCSRVPHGQLAAADLPANPLAPPNPDGPTPVGVGVRVVEISHVDPILSSFRLSGYVRTSWCDPRLAFDPVAEGSDVRIHVGRGIDQAFQEELWYPGGYPVNARNDMQLTERVLRIHSDGTVEQDINIFVSLANRYDLRRFPFDRHTLELQVESFLWTSDQVVMVDDPTRSGFEPGLELPEWTIESASGRVEERQTLRSNRPFSRFVLSVEIARKPGFYLWKAFLPLSIIVALSWSIFWMTNEKLASRSRISATGVLTIVAYQFVFAADMPRIGYLTLLDRVMVVSFGLLAVTVLQSMYIDRFQETDMPRAELIDRISRWAFPLSYVVMVAMVFMLG